MVSPAVTDSGALFETVKSAVCALALTAKSAAANRKRMLLLGNRLEVIEFDRIAQAGAWCRSPLTLLCGAVATTGLTIARWYPTAAAVSRREFTPLGI